MCMAVLMCKVPYTRAGLGQLQLGLRMCSELILLAVLSKPAAAQQ